MNEPTIAAVQQIADRRWPRPVYATEVRWLESIRQWGVMVVDSNGPEIPCTAESLDVLAELIEGRRCPTVGT